MKTKKALKRLTKIEALISDITAGYSKGALHVRAALQGAKAAFALVKTAVTSEAPSAKNSKAPARKTSKTAERKRSVAGKKAIQKGVRRRLAQKKGATSKIDQASKKAAPVRKKAVAAKKVATKTSTMTATNNAPIRKVTKKKAPKKTAPVPVQIPTLAVEPSVSM